VYYLFLASAYCQSLVGGAIQSYIDWLIG